MSPRQRICEEVIAGRECGRPAVWLVGLPDDGLYAACAEHGRAWASDCRAPLDASPTPIQDAIRNVLGMYDYVSRRLSPAERDVLRDVIACRLARDYLADTGKLDELSERAA